jgi:hypothetical protein
LGDSAISRPFRESRRLPESIVNGPKETLTTSQKL